MIISDEMKKMWESLPNGDLATNNYLDLREETEGLKFRIFKRYDGNYYLHETNSNNLYNGFKLAETPAGNVFTLCEVFFRESASSDKLIARLRFMKTDKDYVPSSNTRQTVIIPFDGSETGYVEFWRMIKILEGLSDLIELGESDKEVLITDSSILNTFKKISDLSSLKDLDLDKISDLNLSNVDDLVNASRIKKVLKTWDDNIENPDETFWQDVFENNLWIISQFFNIPIKFRRRELICLNSSEKRSGEMRTDFAFNKYLSGSMIFVEIKPPTKPVIGSRYRGTVGDDLSENTVYSMSTDLTGGITQVMYSKNMYYAKNDDVLDKKETIHNNKCLLIIGRMPTDEQQQRSFEAFKEAAAHVEILTYDEIFGNLKQILKSMFDGWSE